MTNSHIIVNRFDYYEPASVEDAVAVLAQHGDQAKLLAGGTDLLVQMKIERTAPRAVISINRIPGLDRIAIDDGHLHIGARATIQTIERLPLVGAYYQALAEACANFSSTQVQAMGTVGGNLGNASPAADSAPALIAFGAELELTGPSGTRRLPLEQFFVGPGKTALKVGELITDVVLPQPKPGTGSAFAKVSRVTNDIAKANCAVVVVQDGNRVADCRIVFGSVAPTAMRGRKTEQMLVGQVWSEELVDRAAVLAYEEVAPIDDVRSTAWYRREVVRVMVGDGLRWAWQRASCCDPAGKYSTLPTADAPRWEIAGARSATPSHRPGHRPVETAQATTGAPASVSRLGALDKRVIELKVNGRVRQVWVSPNDLLLNVIRNDLELTGTKYGCGIGECSACTVLMDSKPTLACLVLAVAAVGHDIQTIEGLARPDGTLDPLQEAFIAFAAYQCGYCTPGQLLTAKSLLMEEPHPSEDDVRHYMRGNVCRCTGYAAIVRAVLAAAQTTNDQ